MRVKREHERHLSRTGAWIDHTPLVMHHAWSLSIMRSRPGGGVVGFIDAGAPAFAFDWCTVTEAVRKIRIRDVGFGVARASLGHRSQGKAIITVSRSSCPVTGRADGAAVADVGAGWYGVIAGV